MSFFVLLTHSRLENREFATDCIPTDPHNTGPTARTCSLCTNFTSMLPWLPPYNVELETWGRGYADIVTVPGGDLLISERLLTLVEQHSITGLEGFDPVRIVRVFMRGPRIPAAPPRYFRVAVMQTRAAIDQAASRVDWEGTPVCPECRTGGVLLRWSFAILEPGTWTGEDLFEARGLPGTIFASERFKALVDAHSLRNVILVPSDSEEAGYDFYPWRSKARAQELMVRPLSPKLLEKVLADGSVARYYVPTNDLVTRTPSGELDMFRPVDGKHYWDKLA